jgi:hypothetical protein
MKSRKRQARKMPLLNLAGIGVAAFALTFSVTVTSPEKFLFDAQNLFAAAVGAQAAVPENPYNTLAQQLEDRERALEERETAQGTSPEQAPLANNTWAFVSFGLSVMLFVLVGLNFYLDTRRGSRVAQLLTRRYSVDLR